MKAITAKFIHRWIGIILIIFFIVMSLSGILLNHRKAISKIDIPRENLPKGYQIINWNNASLKSVLFTTDDRKLFYGEIGVWEDIGNDFSELNLGFENGADNQKVNDLLETENGQIFAATNSGVYLLEKKIWRPILQNEGERFLDLEITDDEIFAMSRSNIYKSSLSKKIEFTKINLKTPKNFVPHISFFKFIMYLHSGKLLGIFGVLLVDVIGLVLIFLAITGLDYFIIIRRLKNKKTATEKRKKLSKRLRFSRKNHKKIGIIFLPFLFVIIVSGIFLRPPFLIAIVKGKLNNPKFINKELSSAYGDKLRKFVFEPKTNSFLMATSHGFYQVDRKFEEHPEKVEKIPPYSVMGVNVLKFISPDTLLVGSFSGLYSWNIETDEIRDHISGKQILPTKKRGRPIGKNTVSGFIHNQKGEQYFIDYSQGVIPINNSTRFTEFPNKIKEQSKMSLWNLALEVHVGRIFSVILKNLAWMYIPIGGFLSFITILSGVIIIKKKKISYWKLRFLK